MDAVHTQLDTRWLTDVLTDFAPTTVLKPAPRDTLPESRIERLDLHLGAHLCRVTHRFAPGQTGLRPMAEVSAELGEPVLFVQVTHQGDGVLQDRRLDSRLTHSPGTALFLHLDRIDHVHWAETAAPLEITALVMGLSRLRYFLGEANTRELLAVLALSDPPAASQRPLTPSLASILKSSLSESLTGPLRLLHAQARVLDFLVALTGLLNGLAPPDARQRDRVERVRAELDRDPGQVPDLGELARSHGFSARALNDGFKREFGQTVCAYVADRRLEAAYALLRETRHPLKVVAARLGYASVSHFSHAFARKYGIRPGSIRPGTQD